jgi:hypothetical protein
MTRVRRDKHTSKCHRTRITAGTTDNHAPILSRAEGSISSARRFNSTSFSLRSVSSSSSCSCGEYMAGVQRTERSLQCVYNAFSYCVDAGGRKGRVQCCHSIHTTANQRPNDNAVREHQIAGRSDSSKTTQAPQWKRDTTNQCRRGEPLTSASYCFILAAAFCWLRTIRSTVKACRRLPTLVSITGYEARGVANTAVMWAQQYTTKANTSNHSCCGTRTMSCGTTTSLVCGTTLQEAETTTTSGAHVPFEEYCCTSARRPSSSSCRACSSSSALVCCRLAAPAAALAFAWAVALAPAPPAAVPEVPDSSAPAAALASAPEPEPAWEPPWACA